MVVKYHTQQTRKKISDSVKKSFTKERRARQRMILFNSELPTYKEHQIWKGVNGYPVIKINGKRILLHKHIWIEANGEIPKGYEVHHIDMDKSNYNLKNLILLDHQSHMRYHKGWEKIDGEWFKPCKRCGQKKSLEREFHVHKNNGKNNGAAICKRCCRG